MWDSSVGLEAPCASLRHASGTSGPSLLEAARVEPDDIVLAHAGDASAMDEHACLLSDKPLTPRPGLQ